MLVSIGREDHKMAFRVSVRAAISFVVVKLTATLRGEQRVSERWLSEHEAASGKEGWRNSTRWRFPKERQALARQTRMNQIAEAGTRNRKAGAA